MNYIPSVAGRHSLQVTVRGLPVQGSPLNVNAVHGSRKYSTIIEPQITFGGSGSDNGKFNGTRGIRPLTKKDEFSSVIGITFEFKSSTKPENSVLHSAGKVQETENFLEDHLM